MTTKATKAPRTLSAVEQENRLLRLHLKAVLLGARKVCNGHEDAERWRELAAPCGKAAEFLKSIGVRDYFRVWRS